MRRGMIWTLVFTTPSPTCSVKSSPENNSIHVIIHNATVDITEIKISVENQPWKDINARILQPSTLSKYSRHLNWFNSLWCNLQDVKARLRLDTMTENTVNGTIKEIEILDKILDQSRFLYHLAHNRVNAVKLSYICHWKNPRLLYQQWVSLHPWQLIKPWNIFV